MKLEFSWRGQLDELEPHCTSDTLNSDGQNLLSNLLTDTGGLEYPASVDWLEEGLRRVKAVRSGEAKSLNWGREDWGAKLDRDRVTLYSLHQEDYADVITLDTFETALRAWLKFIQTPWTEMDMERPRKVLALTDIRPAPGGMPEGTE